MSFSAGRQASAGFPFRPREGTWKYLSMDGNDDLFDFAADERERANLAKRYPERLAVMKQAWHDWNEGKPGIPVEVRAILVFGDADIPRASH